MFAGSVGAEISLYSVDEVLSDGGRNENSTTDFDSDQFDVCLG
jgi:hypothetical protein